VVGDKNPVNHIYGDNYDNFKADILRMHAIFFTTKPGKCDFPAPEALKIDFCSFWGETMS
jgi:hypothetical protein